MRLRLGVFATTDGWVVADQDHKECFESRAEALRAAQRQAHLARWRGAEVEILAQELPGGPLDVVDPPLA